MTRSLYPRYPLCRRLGGNQGRPRIYGLQIIILAPTGIEPRFLGRPSRSLVIIQTTLFGLLKIHNITGILSWSLTNEQVPYALVSLNCVCAIGHKAFGLGNRNVFQECNKGLQDTPPISE